MEMLQLIRVLLLRCSARCMTIGWSRRKDATFSKTLTFLLWKPFMSFHLDGGAVLCVLPRDLQEACCCLRVAEGVDWKKRRRLSQLWLPLPVPSIAFVVCFFCRCPANGSNQIYIAASCSRPRDICLMRGNRILSGKRDTFKFPLCNKWMTRDLFDSPDKVCLLIRTLG